MNQKTKKIRLDVAMVEQGLAPSREKAKAIIMAGQVYIDQIKMDKAGDMISPQAQILVKGDTLKYVSRGGLKLEKAMQEYGFNLENKNCMDIGASTGGFTDCMLQNGATKVYSIDVGYGQLAWKLRTDERVINLERTNIRYITHEIVKDEIDFASIDVSFISLTLVIPVLKKFLVSGGEFVCLIKPQFEAGKDKVGKKGVVRDINTHYEVCEKIYDFIISLEMSVKGMTFSPIKGPEGNIEYLFYVKNQADESLDKENLKIMVDTSHEQLK